MQQSHQRNPRKPYEKRESEPRYNSGFNGHAGLAWGSVYKVLCVIIAVACAVSGFLIILERRTTRLETIREIEEKQRQQQASPQPQPPTLAAPSDNEATDVRPNTKVPRPKRKKKPTGPQMSTGPYRHDL